MLERYLNIPYLSTFGFVIYNYFCRTCHISQFHQLIISGTIKLNATKLNGNNILDSILSRFVYF